VRHILAWFALVLALLGTSAQAALPPRPDGPILDQANVIPDDQEAALAARLTAYNKATGRSVVVATVNGLDGETIEDYAQKLAEAWDIGGKRTEEGVLFLVAPSERQLRIHAARGVQDRLTDALSGRIIRDTVVPRFKQNDYGGGIAAGVDGIITQLDRSPADAKAVAEAAEAARRDRGQDSAGAGSVIFWIVLILFFMMVFGRGGRRGRSRRGVDPGIVLWGASEAFRHFGSGGGGGFGGGSSGGGFGGFGGGGGGFDGGGASGSW